MTWSYGTGPSDPTYNAPRTVTDPLGNVQSVFFGSQLTFASWGLVCPPAPSRIDFKDSAGTMLKQVINTLGNDTSSYTDPAPSNWVGPECDNPRVTASTTISSDTNQQSQTTSTFGSFGNVTDSYEYDWGSGAPGPLLRHTSLAYLHDANGAYGDLAAHILNRVTSKTVYDGAGNVMAKTTSAYDSPAPRRCQRNRLHRRPQLRCNQPEFRGKEFFNSHRR